MPHRGARRARPTTADLTRTCGPRGEEWRYGRFSTSHDEGAATVGRAGARCGGGSISSPLGRAGAPLAPRAYRCLAATPELDPGGEILAKPVGESC
jgi:hypothetical protein